MKNLRILVVEDDSDVRRLIVQALGRSDHFADGCGDAVTALEHLRREEYDVLLTDLVMPGASGLELLVEARRDRPLLRCIVMSGHDRVEDAGREVVWLTKPIDLDALDAALDM